MGNLKVTQSHEQLRLKKYTGKNITSPNQKSHWAFSKVKHSGIIKEATIVYWNAFSFFFFLVWFYGISTIVGYLMPNPVYSNILDIYGL